MTIFKKWVIKQMFKEKRKNYKIIVISNKYKDILDNFIHSLDLKLLD